MFEALISSKVRRALLEHIVTHSEDRFYLRGLAKDLGLSVTPLRREIKRLQHSGMLRPVQEANIVFYEVDATSPLFVQLQQPGLQQGPRPSPRVVTPQATPTSPAPVAAARPPLVETGVVEPRGAEALSSPHEPETGSGGPTGRPLNPTGSRSRFWSRPLPAVPLMAMTVVGLSLILAVTGLLYTRVTNGAARYSLSIESRPAGSVQRAELTVRPQESTSQRMRGSRWQILPGGFGAFSSGAQEANLTMGR